MTDVSAEDSAMYADVVRFIIPGFLSSTVRVGECTFSFRSLSPSDLFLLEQFVPSSDPAWKLWVIAASIWVFDGMTLLEDYPNCIRTAYKAVKNLPTPMIDVLFAQVISFFRRYQNASRYLEAYLHEESSRRMWQSLMNGALPISSRTSIPGLDRLGRNPIQVSWGSWNRIEDIRDEQEYAWNLTKVHVSLQSSKASERLNARDQARQESENARRQEVKDNALALFREGHTVNPAAADGTKRLKTERDLRNEFRMWIEGEEDEHDRIIRAYKDRIKHEYESREEEKAKLVHAAELARDPSRDEVSRIYSPQDFQRLFPHAGGGAVPTIRTVSNTDLGTEIFEKHLKPDVTPGGLRVNNGEVEFNPIERPSLNDALATRVPRWNGGG